MTQRRPQKERELHFPKTVQSQGRKIRTRIRKVMAGRSQRAWSRQLGIPQQNISRYLAGGNIPHVHFFIHLARKEGISLNWLILGEGEMTRNGGG